LETSVVGSNYFLVEIFFADIVDHFVDNYLDFVKMVLPIVHIVTNPHFSSKVDKAYSTKIALATSFDSDNPKNYFFNPHNSCPFLNLSEKQVEYHNHLLNACYYTTHKFWFYSRENHVNNTFYDIKDNMLLMSPKIPSLYLFPPFN